MNDFNDEKFSDEQFNDGIVSLTNMLIAQKDQTSNSRFFTRKLSKEDIRQIDKEGIARMITKVKSSYALKDTLLFSSNADEDFYNAKLKMPVLRAVRSMFAWGRGIIIVHEKDADLSKPIPASILEKKDPYLFDYTFFDGDQMSVIEGEGTRRLGHRLFLKPEFYIPYQGGTVHNNRVIDFVNDLPTAREMAEYEYGGISEYQFIYQQLVNDAILTRGCANIVDKSSNMFYKIKGYKQMVADKKEQVILNYIGASSLTRGLYGDGVIDGDDDLVTFQQAISQIKELDEQSLRRLAAVTRIPVSVFVGESVRGLNATGENEQNMFQDCLEEIQEFKILPPLNQLFFKLKLGEVKTKQNQAESPRARAELEGVQIDNATKLDLIGEDGSDYLRDKGMLKYEDDEEDFLGFGKIEEEPELDLSKSLEELVNGKTGTD